MPFRIIAIASVMLATLFLDVLPVKADTADLEKRLQQQERRIDRLEQAVESLQGRLMDAQYGETGGPSASRARNRNAVDPLLGTWACTNKVFKYDISFFDDGRLIQEEPFLSKAKGGSWSRLDEERFATEKGMTFSTSFRSSDELTVTNMSNKSVWECSRIQ